MGLLNGYFRVGKNGRNCLILGRAAKWKIGKRTLRELLD
jgi:hypothetical protein